jgi:hypothetical protein
MKDMLIKINALGLALAGALGLGLGCDVEDVHDIDAEDVVDAELRGGNIFCGGFANIPCPAGLSCIDDPGDDCNPAKGGADCSGICVGPAMCGGLLGLPCEGKGEVCVDDPSDDCDPNGGGDDCSGLCVLPVACGGFAGIPCDEGFACVDDPRDDCAPPSGADCGGLCVPDASACTGYSCAW